MEFQYISCNPKILGGKACIRGTRISVELILEWLANGSTIDEICAEFDQLSRESVREAILYAGQRSRDEFFYEVKVA